ncbi:hypothetical protein HDU85_005910 [Gaertneriomyces sp. JEL0708]|nr:hypothetical protein HDU85_005910 [Gaertneriomyces sp. JEL0708]
MTVTPFKRKLVHIQDCTVRGTRDILDFSDGCANVVQISTTVPNNLNFHVICPTTGDILYFDTNVLARHSKFFRALNQRHRENSGFHPRDINNDSKKTQKEIEDEEKKVKDLRAMYEAVEEHTVSYKYEGYDDCKYELKSNNLSKRRSIIIDIFKWCYSKDNSQLNINISNIYACLYVESILDMSDEFNDVMDKKILNVKLDSADDPTLTLYETCEPDIHEDLLYMSNLPKCGMQLSCDPTLGLLLEPVYLLAKSRMNIPYCVLTARRLNRNVVSRYGSKNIIKYLSKISDIDSETLEIAKVIYAE